MSVTLTAPAPWNGQMAHSSIQTKKGFQPFYCIKIDWSQFSAGLYCFLFAHIAVQSTPTVFSYILEHHKSFFLKVFLFSFVLKQLNLKGLIKTRKARSFLKVWLRVSSKTWTLQTLRKIFHLCNWKYHFRGHQDRIVWLWHPHPEK